MTTPPLLSHDVQLHPVPFAEMFVQFQLNRPWVQVLRVRKQRPRRDAWIQGPQNTPFLFFLN